MTFLDDIYTEMGEILEGEFSQSVLIEIGANSASLNCIFNKTYLEVNLQGETVQSNAPMLGIDKTAADTALGTELIEGPDSYATISSIKYKIKRVEDDGTGYAQLFLKNPVS